MNGRPYVDQDLLVVGGLVGFALAIAAAFLPELLALPLLAAALAGAVIMSGLLGRQRGGLYRAVFVGMAPVSGLLLAFFGYVAGTVEYWAATETRAEPMGPRPARRRRGRRTGGGRRRATAHP